MILKCIDGPMNGSIYPLSRDSTNRKPDGLWFDGQQDDGQWVQHQYGFDRLADGGDHVTMIYRFGGSIPLLVPGMAANRTVSGKPDPGFVADVLANGSTEAALVLRKAGLTADCCECGEMFPREEFDAGEIYCRKCLAEKQSHKDLAASGGIVDAP